MEQHYKHSDERQSFMHGVLLVYEHRTEHAKAVRRRTGSNDFRNKQWVLRIREVMQCVGTCFTADNLVAIEFE